MQVFCLTRSLRDLPAGEAWLTDAERSVLARLRFVRRRRDWLLGRWTAKQALALCAGTGGHPLTGWEVLAGEDGAPRVTQDGRPSELALSISHSGGTAFCCVLHDAGPPGCDIEQVAPRDPVFLETFLTGTERKRVASAPAAERAALTTLFWSAKESVLKVLRLGLRADTYSIEVEAAGSPGHEAWQRYRARQAGTGRNFEGWWRHSAGFIFTVAADRACSTPVSLESMLSGHAIARPLPEARGRPSQGPGTSSRPGALE